MPPRIDTTVFHDLPERPTRMDHERRPPVWLPSSCVQNQRTGPVNMTCRQYQDFVTELKEHGFPAEHPICVTLDGGIRVVADDWVRRRAAGEARLKRLPVRAVDSDPLRTWRFETMWSERPADPTVHIGLSAHEGCQYVGDTPVPATPPQVPSFLGISRAVARNLAHRALARAMSILLLQDGLAEHLRLALAVATDIRDRHVFVLSRDGVTIHGPDRRDRYPLARWRDLPPLDLMIGSCDWFHADTGLCFADRAAWGAAVLALKAARRIELATVRVAIADPEQADLKLPGTCLMLAQWRIGADGLTSMLGETLCRCEVRYP